MPVVKKGYRVKNSQEMMASLLGILKGDGGSPVLAAVDFLVDMIGYMVSPLLDKEEHGKKRPVTPEMKENLLQAARDAKRAVNQVQPANPAQAKALNALGKEINNFGRNVSAVKPDEKKDLQQLINDQLSGPRMQAERRNTVKRQVSPEEKALIDSKSRMVAEKMFETVVRVNPGFKAAGRDLEYYRNHPEEKERFLEKIIKTNDFKKLTGDSDLKRLTELAARNAREIFSDINKLKEAEREQPGYNRQLQRTTDNRLQFNMVNNMNV